MLQLRQHRDRQQLDEQLRGGLVGSDYNGWTTARWCYNLGGISYRGGNSSAHAGGIIGYTHYNTQIYSCYNAGTVTDASGGNSHGALLGGSYGDNGLNYWLEGTSDQSSPASSAKGVMVSSADLCAADMAAKLNSDENGNALAEDQRLFKEGVPFLNGGYPLLAWQGDVAGAAITVGPVW